MSVQRVDAARLTVISTLGDVPPLLGGDDLRPPAGPHVTINELMIVTGQMLALAINALLDAVIHDPQVWRLMLGVASIPAIALLIGMLILPESPRWFAIRNRFAESRRILDMSRSPEEAESESREIVESATTARNEQSHARRDLKENPWMRKLLWIGSGLAVVQQATGINTVNYYRVTFAPTTTLHARPATHRKSSSAHVHLTSRPQTSRPTMT